MNKIEYLNAMSENKKQFSELLTKIAADTNAYIDKNGKINEPFGNFEPAQSLAADLCLSGAWIEDRLNGLNYRDKKSRSKKVRKALVYYES